MKLQGVRRLQRQLKAMPRAVQEEVAAQVKKTTEQAAKVARMLVPVATGELKGWIRTSYSPRGIRGVVDAAPRGDREAHAKARAVEFGRKRGNRGVTAAQNYIRRAEAYVAKGFKSRLSRAIKRGVKKAAGRV